MPNPRTTAADTAMVPGVRIIGSDGVGRHGAHVHAALVPVDVLDVEHGRQPHPGLLGVQLRRAPAVAYRLPTGLRTQLVLGRHVEVEPVDPVDAGSDHVRQQRVYRGEVSDLDGERRPAHVADHGVVVPRGVQAELRPSHGVVRHAAPPQHLRHRADRLGGRGERLRRRALRAVHLEPQPREVGLRPHRRRAPHTHAPRSFHHPHAVIQAPPSTAPPVTGRRGCSPADRGSSARGHPCRRRSSAPPRSGRPSTPSARARRDGRPRGWWRSG